tara:strand:- start:1470 stop:2600 length:1131 start_codon:yes stop_codon:yes gene_type:complete
MAVVSVNILHNGWGASEDIGTKTTFTVVYLVEVDDKNDGAMIVMIADDGITRIPRRFEMYAVGNDSDAFAFVKSKSPTPIDDKFWHVTVTFGPNEPSGEPGGQQLSGLDDRLIPTDNPLREVIDVSVTVVSATRAAERGAYIGQIDLPIGNVDVNDDGYFSNEGFWPILQGVEKANGDNLGRIINGVPITNSVFTPFDPPPEINYNQMRITAGMNCDQYPGRLAELVNSVNDREVTLDAGAGFFRFGFGEFFPPYTLRFMGFNTQRRFKNGVPFWRIEIEYLADLLFGWRLDILDRGYCVKSNETVSDGAPSKNNIIDVTGNQISEPVLLDGNGNMLDLETHAATYLRYAVYPEIDFGAAGISNFHGLKMEFTNND